MLNTRGGEPRGWGREAPNERGRVGSEPSERGLEISPCATLSRDDKIRGLAQAEQLFQIVFFVEDPGGGA